MFFLIVPKTLQYSYFVLCKSRGSSRSEIDLLFSSTLQVFHVATTLAQNFFNKKLVVSLSDVEASILLCIGLQLKDISSLEVWVSNFDNSSWFAESIFKHVCARATFALYELIGFRVVLLLSQQDSLKLGRSHIMSKFNKLMKKFYEHLRAGFMKEISSSFPQDREVRPNCWISLTFEAYVLITLKLLFGQKHLVLFLVSWKEEVLILFLEKRKF